MQMILESNAGDAAPGCIYGDLSFNTWKGSNYSDMKGRCEYWESVVCG